MVLIFYKVDKVDKVDKMPIYKNRIAPWHWSVPDAQPPRLSFSIRANETVNLQPATD